MLQAIDAVSSGDLSFIYRPPVTSDVASIEAAGEALLAISEQTDKAIDGAEHVAQSEHFESGFNTQAGDRLAALLGTTAADLRDRFPTQTEALGWAFKRAAYQLRFIDNQWWSYRNEADLLMERYRHIEHEYAICAVGADLHGASLVQRDALGVADQLHGVRLRCGVGFTDQRAILDRLAEAVEAFDVGPMPHGPAVVISADGQPGIELMPVDLIDDATNGDEEGPTGDYATWVVTQFLGDGTRLTDGTLALLAWGINPNGTGPVPEEVQQAAYNLLFDVPSTRPPVPDPPVLPDPNPRWPIIDPPFWPDPNPGWPIIDPPFWPDPGFGWPPFDPPLWPDPNPGWPPIDPPFWPDPGFGWPPIDPWMPTIDLPDPWMPANRPWMPTIDLPDPWMPANRPWMPTIDQWLPADEFPGTSMPIDFFQDRPAPALARFESAHLDTTHLAGFAAALGLS